MPRTPEPEELMDRADQAEAYAAADFSEANSLFIELLTGAAAGDPGARVLDLGCGPADIPLQLAQRFPNMHIDAVDGAQAMLDLADRALDGLPALRPRVRLVCDLLPCAALPSHAYDAVISNSLLHHLSNPALIWQTITRSTKPGALVLVMDLARPDSVADVDDLVGRYAADAPTVLRQDFRNSLFAAYRVDEVEAQLAAAGLSQLRVDSVSDRHLAVSGRID
ncbi:MAG: class I SAM-dependent methyltransferase [Gammaproteobacteria bacterium]|nr:class I SAM-dependent methyltransferase [Gammaproteobacteria bacterium]